MKQSTLNHRRGQPPDELAETIGAYLDRDGRSLNRIAQASLVDVGYLWRLKAGLKKRPSRDLLIRLALALKLEPEELDVLLVTADYAPITLRQL
ncbi:MAG TPA: helix-turn-helix transcriptional regulator [Methylomirabilota bacterium]|nr:helix-turn-helix transcriptional regulator [Methylomirabilota bacterium]